MSLTSQTFSTGQAAVAPPVAGPQAGDTPDMLLAKSLHVLSGGSGATVVSGTVPQAMSVLGFIVLADVIFSAVAGLGGYTTDGLTGVSFPAGMTLPFRLSGFTLASGSVLAVKA